MKMLSEVKRGIRFKAVSTTRRRDSPCHVRIRQHVPKSQETPLFQDITRKPEEKRLLSNLPADIEEASQVETTTLDEDVDTEKCTARS